MRIVFEVVNKGFKVCRSVKLVLLLESFKWCFEGSGATDITLVYCFNKRDFKVCRSVKRVVEILKWCLDGSGATEIALVQCS